MSEGLRISIIGSRGIPARYGGFETFAEELAPRLVERGHEVTVYCRRGYAGADPPESYEGVRLRYTPYLRLRSLETLSHEFTSIVRSLSEDVDIAYFLGTRGAPWYLLVKPFRRVAVVHTDGLEWKRRKWDPLGRAYLRFAEWLAASVAADEVVTDAEAMRAYYRDRYGRDSTCIPYGAPLVGPARGEVLERWNLVPGGFDLVVCRLEPENNVDTIIREHRASGTSTELVIVGDAPYPQAYQGGLRASAEPGRVRFLGAVYDGVDDLYAGCRIYLHGHEVGGLNPGLLRAMGAGACCFALGTPFNEEAIGEAGRFWTKEGSVLASLIRGVDEGRVDAAALGESAKVRAASHYSWDDVAARHDSWFRILARGASAGSE